MIAAVVIVAAVVCLAMGRGGALSAERSDYFPIELGPVSATDVALLRPPTGLWGYNTQATDEAMERIAESIRERDVRIVALEQLVTDLSRDHAPMPMPAAPYRGARHRRPAAAPDTAEAATAGAATAEAIAPETSAPEHAAADEPGEAAASPPPEESHD